MSGTKQKYNVYEVVECYDPWDGKWRVVHRALAGTTWAVSEAKARVNVEYRRNGKAMYGGGYVRDIGGDNAYEVYYEAVLADDDT